MLCNLISDVNISIKLMIKVMIKVNEWSGGIAVSTLVCLSLGQWFNYHSLTLIYALSSSCIEK